MLAILSNRHHLLVLWGYFNRVGSVELEFLGDFLAAVLDEVFDLAEFAVESSLLAVDVGGAHFGKAVRFG